MKRQPRHRRHHGFSLTEVLLAAGILVVGFLLICCTLPVGIHLTGKATERSIAAVIADEAFAKIRLFGIQPVEKWPGLASQGIPVDPNTMQVDYSQVAGTGINPSEFAWPSTDIRPETKKYYWSALLRYDPVNLGEDTFHVTVFVARIAGLGVKYPIFDRAGLRRDNLNQPLTSGVPVPILIPVTASLAGPTNVIRVLVGMVDPDGLRRTITDDSVLVDDGTGQVMRILERGYSGNPSMLLLDGKVFDSDLDRDGSPDVNRYVWLLPPALGGGRYPGIAVYQRTITFDQTP